VNEINNRKERGKRYVSKEKYTGLGYQKNKNNKQANEPICRNK